VEKFPDLAEEKEARLKELRFRDRDAQQKRVRQTTVSCFTSACMTCASNCYFPAFEPLVTKLILFSAQGGGPDSQRAQGEGVAARPCLRRYYG
jgi:hypothetical protein